MTFPSDPEADCPRKFLLRTQNDFSDVFQLAKNIGKHRYWKPYVAHILRFDVDLVETAYDLEEKIEELKEKISTLRLELGSANVDLDQALGLIEIKEKDVKALQKSADDFDFEMQDAAINEDVVEKIDTELASLNTARYTSSRHRKRLLDSLEAQSIQFSPWGHCTLSGGRLSTRYLAVSPYAPGPIWYGISTDTLVARALQAVLIVSRVKQLELIGTGFPASASLPTASSNAIYQWYKAA